MRKIKSPYHIDLDLADSPEPAYQAAGARSKTGVKGVSICKNGKYRASLTVSGARKSLGYFSSLPEAADAVKHAEAFYGPSSGKLVRVAVSVHPDHIQALQQHVKLNLQEPFTPDPRSRFTADEISSIQRLSRSRQKKQVEIAAMYNCGQGTISKIIRSGCSTGKKRAEQSLTFLRI